MAEEQIASTDIIGRISAHLAAEPAEQPEQEAPQEAQAEQPEQEQAEPEQQAEAEQEQPDDDVIEIGDLNALAEHLGVDPSELYKVAIPFTKDGKKQEFTLGDIKDRYQALEEANSVREVSQRQLEQYRAAEQQLVAMIQEQNVQASAYIQGVERLALQPFQHIDWNNLRATNPGEFINKQQQLSQVQAQIQQLKQGAQQHLQKQQEQFKNQTESLKREREAREQQALLRAIPEWQDQKVADAERQSLAEYMLKSGYSVDEINAVDDHRAILLVRDAMRYREMRDKGDIAAKKVVRIAKKIAKPGARPSKDDRSQTQAAELAKKHRANPGNMDLAAARLAQRLQIGRR